MKDGVYDFGYTSSLQDAADAGVTSKEHLYRHALNKHRIAIMAAYFDVLLADIGLARDQEAMTVALPRIFSSARLGRRLSAISVISFCS